MTFRFKTAHALFLPVILLGVGGCAQNSGSDSAASGNPLKNLASSFLAARSFDRANTALKNNNGQALRAASEDLERSARNSDNATLAPLSIRLLALSGMIQDGKATNSTVADSKTQLIAESNQNYRAALKALPSDYQKIAQLGLDSLTLNALGYFLADRGKTPEDFQLAEFLTAASLAQQNSTIRALSAEDPRLAPLIFSAAIGAGDSKAWALFKQKRYAQARSEQEDVMNTLREYASSSNQSISADIPYHLAEIYLAMDELSLAEASYEEALALSPDPTLNAKIEARLKALKNSRLG